MENPPPHVPVLPERRRGARVGNALTRGRTWVMRAMTPAVAKKLLWEATIKWWNDDAPHLGAALAFYTVLSAAPLFVLALAGLGLMLGEQAAQDRIVAQLGYLLGKEGAAAMQALIENARHQPDSGLVATVAGLLALLFGASGVLAELQDALNRVWDAPRTVYVSVSDYVTKRLFSLGMILGIGFILLISLIISAVLSAVADHVGSTVPGFDVILRTVHFIVSFLVATLLFALLFKVLPDVEIAWHHVAVGACFTAVLFSVGKFFMGLYLGRTTVTSSYGAAGSVVVLLLWVYFSSQIFFFGAEFTRAYARHHLPPVESEKA